jgi:stearoyl-CoA desaturase (Delta-9 desaturase)
MSTALLEHPAESAYDEAPAESPLPPRNNVMAVLTGIVVFGPLLALAGVLIRLWGHGVSLRDVIMAVVIYAIAGHGVTVGFHRLFAHRAFKANRPLKIVLGLAGSLAFEGGVIAWVANHRCHHAHTDREGDPHTPVGGGRGVRAELRGLWHAHMGWMFRPPEVSNERYAPDLLADHDLRVVNALFPVACVVTLAVPFALGWVLGGTFGAAVSGLFWAGIIRIGLLHHMTWSINSICHTFGKRPFKTGDRSGNVAVLSVLSMGESWHNAHHAFPASARHGVEPHQIDSSAIVIRGLERAGWARGVHWPDADRIASKRITVDA